MQIGQGVGERPVLYLVRFLLQTNVSQKLVDLRALESATPPSQPQADWDKLLADLEQATAETRAIFLR